MNKQLLITFLLSAFLILAACGTETKDNNVDDPADEETTSELESEEENTEEELKVSITATGVYNGQADLHTIEIETDKGPIAFQLTMAARGDIEQLTEGDQVTYTYYKEEEQLVIESIMSEGSPPSEDTNTDEEAKNSITATGIYNGQADPHTIEIETKEGPAAFQLSAEARTDVKQLTEGNQVTYTYYKKGEQLIIESIMSKDSPSEDANTDKESEKGITAKGVYNGQADPHTIEIETDEGPAAFQLSMEAREDVEQLTVGEQVTYTYYEEGEQLVIESINNTN